jgi:hypothetical protein
VPAYAKGHLAWGLCQRCGLRYLLKELVFDGYFPNIRVCTGCYDPPQPQERLAVVSDTYAVLPPVLSAQVVGPSVVLNWTSIMGPPVGSDPTGGLGPYISQGYEVFRSIDNGVTFQQIASFLNTADEFGALVIETLTYTDPAPPIGPLQYYVSGYDVNETAQNG